MKPSGKFSIISKIGKSLSSDINARKYVYELFHLIYSERLIYLAKMACAELLTVSCTTFEK